MNKRRSIGIFLMIGNRSLCAVKYLFFLKQKSLKKKETCLRYALEICTLESRPLRLRLPCSQSGADTTFSGTGPKSGRTAANFGFWHIPKGNLFRRLPLRPGARKKNRRILNRKLPVETAWQRSTWVCLKDGYLPTWSGTAWLMKWYQSTNDISSAQSPVYEFQSKLTDPISTFLTFSFSVLGIFFPNMYEHLLFLWGIYRHEYGPKLNVAFQISYFGAIKTPVLCCSCAVLALFFPL